MHKKTPNIPRPSPAITILFRSRRDTRERKVIISRSALVLSIISISIVCVVLLASVVLFIDADTQRDQFAYQLHELVVRHDKMIEKLGRVAVVASEVEVMIGDLTRDSDTQDQLVNQDIAIDAVRPLYALPIQLSGQSEFQQYDDLEYINSVLESSKEPFQNLVSVLNSQNGLLSDIPSIWPLENNHGYVTLEFGPNRHPKTNRWYLHKGIDIAGAYGIKVLASANGKVIEAKYDGIGYGNYVLVRHKYGFRTRYSHLSNIYVEEGQDLLQNDIIGTLGNTGISTGPHLDFQIILGTDVIDPAQFLKISRQQFRRWSGNR